ncbi:transcriptional regulation of mitochondrial recombination-domain-containing protein [Hypoxylon argillaceum]|nr:transcriptional regulation of mitochondrial recombination-domain-containing protein [Hypoxylon argillaceum]
MAMRISPLTAQLGKLSLGGGATPRTSIRPASSAKRRRARGERIEPSFEPGHGEKIFVFNHFVDGMTVYSHSPVLKVCLCTIPSHPSHPIPDQPPEKKDKTFPKGNSSNFQLYSEYSLIIEPPPRKQANHAFRQIPFNGKKLRPAKLRKDFWRPMAMIQFPEGHGEVGRSVFQRLRECKTLHELCWDDSLLYGPSGRTLSTRARGRRLNDQRANTIADMAAVLGGLGKGNRIVVESDPAAAAAAAPATAAEGKGEGEGATATAAAAATAAPVLNEEGKTLLPATVWWANGLDRNYAKKWTKNVRHELFEQAVLERLQSSQEREALEGEGGESQSVPAELAAEQELTKGAEQSQSQRL